MEMKMLYTAVFAILLTGLIAGVGVLLLDKTAIAVKTETTVVNESITIAAGTVTLANDDVLSISTVANSTGNGTRDAAITLNEQINWTTAGVITVGGDMGNGVYNITYAYDKDSAATTAMAAGRDATADVPEDWLALIVLIVVMAIILTMVLSSFANPRS